MITRRDRRFLAHAATVAFLGQHHRVRVGAVLSRKGCIVASRANVPGPIPSIPFYAGHAERRVLGSAKPKSTLYVARIDLNGRVVASQPCDACMAAIADNGNVRKIVYFDGEEIRKVKV